MITVFHKGKLSPDLKRILEFNLKINPITFIGDDSSIESLKGLTYFDYRYMWGRKTFDFFDEHFKVAYAITPEYQQNVFLRAFVVCSLILDYKIGPFYHMDSDTLLYYPEKSLGLCQDAFFVPQDYGNKYRMGSSIHFSFLTSRFAEAFVEEFTKFYVDGKQDWAKEKMEFHQQSGIIGELTDMAFYHLIAEKIKPMNLLKKPMPGMPVFDFNIAMGEGSESKDDWEKEGDLKKIIFSEKGYPHFVYKNGEEIPAASIHLQGINKKLTNSLTCLADVV